MKKDKEDFTEWTNDALDEEIFECEQTMIYEYTNGRGRKLLINYWQKLEDVRNGRLKE